MGRQLAMPKNLAENEAVSYIQKSVWIGFSDEAVEGEWKDAEMTPMVYENWANAEPNNKEAYNCAQLYSNKQWYENVLHVS